MKTGFLFRPGKKREYEFDEREEDEDSIRLISKDSIVTLSKSEIEREIEYADFSADEERLRTIAVLEASMTPRRMREAVLGTDNGWLAATETKIKELRNA
jgi:hypothetical protein